MLDVCGKSLRLAKNFFLDVLPLNRLRIHHLSLHLGTRAGNFSSPIRCHTLRRAEVAAKQLVGTIHQVDLYRRTAAPLIMSEVSSLCSNGVSRFLWLPNECATISIHFLNLSYAVGRPLPPMGMISMRSPPAIKGMVLLISALLSSCARDA
jgi:hypothetical protein